MYINIILYSHESFPAKVFPMPSWHVYLRRKRIYEKKYSSIFQEVQSILPPFLFFGVKVAGLSTALPHPGTHPGGYWLELPLSSVTAMCKRKNPRTLRFEKVLNIPAENPET
jgi:hypothetical protein